MADPITDLYQNLFGRINIRDGSVVEMSEHGRVNSNPANAGFKRVVNIDPITGQAVGATVSVVGSLPVTQSGLWYVNQSGPWSVNATIYGNFGAASLTDVNLTKVAGASITLGQKNAVDSIPVVLAVDQYQVPVTQSGQWAITATIGNIPNVVVTSLPSLSVLANQGGNWLVNASVPNPVQVTQSGLWSINATVSGALDVRQLGLWAVNQTGPWIVNASIPNPVTVNLASYPTLTVLAIQSGNWVTNASVPSGVTVNNASIPVTQSGSWNVNATVFQGNAPWNVMATILNSQPVAISSLPSLTVISNQGGVWNVTATIGGTVTGRLEDGAHTTGDQGEFILAVRNDFASLATMTSNNLDYSPIAVDDKGRVEIAQSIGALSNGAETTVTGTAIGVLNANPNRLTAIIQNTGVANVRIGVAGLSTVTGIRLVPGGSVVYENPFVPTATITAIREGATNSTVFAQEIA